MHEITASPLLRGAFPALEGDRLDILLAAASVNACLDSGNLSSVAAFFADMQAADIADVIAELDQPHAVLALDQLAIRKRAQVFGYLPVACQATQVAALRRGEIVALFRAMSADERVDVFKALPVAEQERVVPALAQAEREDIRRLASYPEGTAGAVMTSEYATLAGDLTARDAVEALRRVAPDKETIYVAFIVDAERHVTGVVSLRDLIVAAPTTQITDIMETRVVLAHAADSATSAAETIARYDISVLPVLDGSDRLVGIITADDAMDIVEARNTDTFHRAGTVINMTTSLREASVMLLFRKRVFWLVVLVFGNIFSGAGIALFEDLIAAHIALVFFLPLLIDSGGNAGAQSATLMVRALATGDVRPRDWRRLLGRETGVAILLGAALGLTVAGPGLVRGGPEIAAVVSLTMLMTVVSGSLIGMSLPFLLSRLKLDPATASAPLVTSIADTCGVMIYFFAAMCLLPDLEAPAFAPAAGVTP